MRKTKQKTISARAFVVAAGLCVLGRPAAAQKRTTATDRQAIVALENEWLTATDSVTLTRILGEDFVHPVPTGDFLTKSQHVRWVTAHPPPKSVHYRFDRMDVRVYGDVGIVNGTVVAADTLGKELDRTVFTDVFVYRRGGWQAVNGQETTVGLLPSRSRSTMVSRDSLIGAQVERSLRDYYRGFELEDSSRLAAGVTPDFDSYFSIPAHDSGLERYDAAGVAAGFGAALRHYHGHAPRMELSDILVLARSDTTAVASYRMLFYLDGALRNDALAVSELRQVGGTWKLARHFEAKRH